MAEIESVWPASPSARRHLRRISRVRFIDTQHAIETGNSTFHASSAVTADLDLKSLIIE
jgi:hypothetical protein